MSGVKTIMIDADLHEELKKIKDFNGWSFGFLLRQMLTVYKGKG